jgi:hypothetical protein
VEDAGLGDADDGAAQFVGLVGDLAAEEGDEAAVDEADHLLAGLEGFGDLVAERVGEDLVDEGADDGLADVGVDEGSADIFEGFLDVGLGDLALAGELAVDGAEGVGEAVEHGDSRGVRRSLAGEGV